MGVVSGLPAPALLEEKRGEQRKERRGVEWGSGEGGLKEI
jgi:hypothetical protein